jgi:hypothetical protein
MRERALEQCLLKASDRNQRERWLRREGPQVACSLRLAAQRDYLATDDASGRVITFAARLEQRHGVWVANVDPQVHQVCEVATPRDEELRANPRILGERWTTIDNQRREAGARGLDREGETNRSRTDDSYVKFLTSECTSRRRRLCGSSGM